MRKSLQLALLIALATAELSAAELAYLRNGHSIRDEYHETLGDNTRLYLDTATNGSFVDLATSEIERFEAAPPEWTAPNPLVSTPYDLGVIIRDASSRSRIDADFIASVIHAESANNPRAVSPRGAQGLMQLMPDTAKGLGVKNSFDPVENVEAGTQFLRELLLRYNGDAGKALAAYNAGPQRVQQYKGVPPYPETHAYIARVLGDYNRKKLAQRQGQSHPAAAKPAARRPNIETAAEKPQPDLAGDR